MAKAALIMDMPESCWECPCMKELYEYSICEVKTKVCDEYEHNRPGWCPLRELPEEANHPEYWDNGRFDKGWNACLDEILAKGRMT